MGVRIAGTCKGSVHLHAANNLLANASSHANDCIPAQTEEWLSKMMLTMIPTNVSILLPRAHCSVKLSNGICKVCYQAGLKIEQRAHALDGPTATRSCNGAIKLGCPTHHLQIFIP